ncbi:HNH endonuclease signature motif containing protein [Mycolicibacterium fortuitum]
MPWGEGNPIPAHVVREVRHRDQDQCQLGYAGCTGQYDEIDHIVNVASLGVSRRDLVVTADDLQLVCKSCHTKKTAREAAAGRGKWKRQPERWPWSPDVR